MLWAVHRNEKNRDGATAGQAMNRIEFTEGDDALAFYGWFKVFAPGDRTYPVIRTDSYCRVDWDGDLLGVVGQVEARRPWTNPDPEVVLNFEAPVERGILLPLWHLASGERRDGPVPLSARGGVLVLTQPTNRLVGLHVGQRWRLPQIDFLAFLRPTAGEPIRTVEAVVGEGVLERRLQGSVACFVIDYLGDDDTRARTWVRQSDGRVEQQEFTHGDTRYLIERESRY
jgi:hypothetical protein